MIEARTARILAYNLLFFFFFFFFFFFSRSLTIDVLLFNYSEVAKAWAVSRSA